MPRRTAPGRMTGMAGGVRIGILGPLEARTGTGAPVALPGARLRRLLLRLALDPGRVVLTSQLIDAIWESAPPAGAANALQSLVSRLRRLLPGAVASAPAGYRLAVEPGAVDAVRFEALALAGRRELDRDPQQAGRTLREALALWRGPALADAAGAEFAQAAIARLEELRLAALEDRIEADLATGGDGALLAELGELAAAHPLRERLCGQLMRALAARGRQAEALAAYEQLRARLAEELGVDPSAELQAVHVAVLRGEPAAAARARPAPTPAAGTAPRTNLRAQITSFVGRERDLAQVTAALSSARLVTLVGPGGVGKSRLASEVAARLLDRMPGGAWLVELAPLSDPAGLAQAVLAVLGAGAGGPLPLRAGRPAEPPPEERLAAAIGSRKLLLILDNCEHLVGSAAALAERLLARCPELRVLATSREPLGLAGEQRYPVEPLPVPGEGASAAEVLSSPAVRLLADRAAAARPGFRVTAANAGPVLRICRALDGIPLAIELAAARLRALTPEQVADRLGDRFRLLAGASRSGLPRHQALRAVVDWSWELLSEAERALLRRLAVFPGGAALPAAERVCADPGLGGLDPGEVLYLLAALADKSLVAVVEGGAGGEVRYTLLETVRAYGLERCREAGEEAALRAAHARYFLELAEQADPELRRRDQVRWIRRLAAERGNLHAALRWAVEAGDAGLALRLVAALSWYWLLHSARSEVGWVDRALALPAGAVPPAIRARALIARVLLELSGGFGSGPDAGRWVARLEAARDLASGLPPGAPGAGHPLLALLPVLLGILRGDEAEVLAAARELAGHPDPLVRAFQPLMLAMLLFNLGEVAEAEAMAARALPGLEALGERWGLGQALLMLAQLHSLQGRSGEAAAALEAACAAFAELGAREEVGAALVLLAAERARAGQLGAAQESLEAAARAAGEVGSEELHRWVLGARAELALQQGRPGEARAALARALAPFAPDYPADQGIALLLAARCQVDAAMGALEGARGWYRRALQAALPTRDRPVIARVVEAGAAVALAAGDAAQAAELLGTAEALRGLPDRGSPEVARVRGAARAALGGEGFARAYRRGAARPQAEALAALAAALSGPAPAA